jgi:uncharacterized protein YjbI with pentapeptide repeats
MRKPGPFEEAQIKAVLLRHRAHLKGDPRGERADLSFRNLSGMVLKGQAFNNIILRGANLADSEFSECNLSGADFSGADLENADFHNTILTGADFRGANLSRTILSNCQLQGADFSIGGASGSDSTRLTEAKLDHALLCQANLSGCDMSGAELVDADLSGADLSRAILIGAELSGATLNNVKLSNTVLELSRLSSSQRSHIGSPEEIIERTYNYIPPAMIRAAVRKHQEWIESGGDNGRRMDFEGIQISECSLRGTNLAGARLRKCSLRGMDLAQVVLDMADMAYSDLRDANLSGASLKGTTLRGADLSRSNLSEARIEAMAMRGNKLWPANLDGAILQSADLTNASFAHAIMNYADMTDCIISGTKFIDVDLTKAKKLDTKSKPSISACGRMAQRYTDPRLFVKTPHGVFPTVNWSLSGVCLSYNGEERFLPDAEVPAKVVAEGCPPPKDARLAVVKDDAHRGVVMLKFVSVDDALASYLKSLVT